MSEDAGALQLPLIELHVLVSQHGRHTDLLQFRMYIEYRSMNIGSRRLKLGTDAFSPAVFREDERLELVDGTLVVREPPGDPHAPAVDLAVAALRQAFGMGWLVEIVATRRRSSFADRAQPRVSSFIIRSPDRPSAAVTAGWSGRAPWPF